MRLNVLFALAAIGTELLGALPHSWSPPIGSEPCVAHVESLEYPEVARAAHIDGIVSLRLKVALDGRVDSVEKLSGPEILAKEAEKNAGRWVFFREPHVNTVEVQYEFRLTQPRSDSRVPAAVKFDLPTKVLVTAPERETNID